MSGLMSTMIRGNQKQRDTFPNILQEIENECKSNALISEYKFFYPYEQCTMNNCVHIHVN